MLGSSVIQLEIICLGDSHRPCQLLFDPSSCCSGSGPPRNRLVEVIDGFATGCNVGVSIAREAENNRNEMEYRLAEQHEAHDDEEQKQPRPYAVDPRHMRGKINENAGHQSQHSHGNRKVADKLVLPVKFGRIMLPEVFDKPIHLAPIVAPAIISSWR